VNPVSRTLLALAALTSLIAGCAATPAGSTSPSAGQTVAAPGSQPPTLAPTHATTPAPTPSPGAFTSPLYGYSVDRPVGWQVTSATVRWPDGAAYVGATPQWFDVFVQPDSSFPNVGYNGVGAQPIPPGSTGEAWMLAYAKRQAESAYACKGPVEAWTQAVVRTLTVRRIDIVCEGKLPSGEDATGWHSAEVAFAVGGTGYVIRGNPEGLDRLLGSFQPAGPSDSRLPVSFTSPLYRYTVSRPADWVVTVATVPWLAATMPSSANVDQFEGPAAEEDYVRVIVAAQPVPVGMTPGEWILDNAKRQAASGRDCKGAVDAWTDAVVGSLQIRRVDMSCYGMGLSDVAFVVDGIGYMMSGNQPVIALFLDTFEPRR
jgi:hypothetical protein